MSRLLRISLCFVLVLSVFAGAAESKPKPAKPTKISIFVPSQVGAITGSVKAVKACKARRGLVLFESVFGADPQRVDTTKSQTDGSYAFESRSTMFASYQVKAPPKATKRVRCKAGTSPEGSGMR